MDKSRRKIIAALGATLIMAPFSKVVKAAELAGIASSDIGNFKYIYQNSSTKEEFYNFLVNVFNLYPEDKLNDLISEVTKSEDTDKQIYIKAQNQLPTIKPFLGDLRYSIPALRKQKEVIAKQTTDLLGKERKYNNYLEVGSNGRYLDSLEERLDIDGEIFLLSEFDSTYSPIDIVDRGQLLKAGKDVKLNNYKPDLAKYIDNQSIDLVTVYIGFHHCPVNLREEFITSIRDAMTDKGVLILRDHNVHNKKMLRMVSLAHDVFNMGTDQTWKYNEDELRNFYSLVQLEEMLSKFGFKSDGRKLYQQGDPTMNALMMYTKA